MIRLVLVLLCIYPFVKWHGTVGVAEATLVSSLQGLVFIFYVCSRLLHLDLWHVLRVHVLKLAGILGGFLVLYLLLGNRIDAENSIFFQAGVGLALMVLYLFSAVVAGVLPAEEGRRLLRREFWKTA